MDRWMELHIVGLLYIMLVLREGNIHWFIHTYIHTTTTYVRGWLCESNHVVECHRVFLVFGLCRILQWNYEITICTTEDLPSLLWYKWSNEHKLVVHIKLQSRSSWAWHHNQENYLYSSFEQYKTADKLKQYSLNNTKNCWQTKIIPFVLQKLNTSMSTWLVHRSMQ